MDPSEASKGGKDARILPDDLLEHVVGGAGPIPPALLAALLRSGGVPDGPAETR